MVYLFVTIRISANQGPELAKAGFQAQKKYPEDESIGKYVIYAAALSSEEGNKIVSIFEPKKGKEREAMMWITKRYQLYSGIEGIKIHTEIAVTYDEALEIA